MNEYAAASLTLRPADASACGFGLRQTVDVDR
jgi:hypothetical protein